MDIKTSDAIAIVNVISKIAQIKPEKDEVTAVRRLLRNQRVISTELKEFEDARKALIDACVEKDAEGNPVKAAGNDTLKLADDHVKEFNDKLTALLEDSIAVELQEVDPEKLPAGVFSSAELYVLEPLFKV